MANATKKAEPKPECGIVMPISAMDGYPASHWDAVKSIITEALATDFDVELVSVADNVGIIQARIVQNLYNNPIVICDISGRNPNVMLELGMRLAFDKAAVVIKDSITANPFDTSPIEYLEYPRDLNYYSIVDFKETPNNTSAAVGIGGCGIILEAGAAENGLRR